MQESPQNRQKSSDYYIVDVFRIARLCGFQNTPIFLNLGIPSPVKNPEKFLSTLPLIEDNFREVAFRYGCVHKPLEHMRGRRFAQMKKKKEEKRENFRQTST